MRFLPCGGVIAFDEVNNRQEMTQLLYGLMQREGWDEVWKRMVWRDGVIV